MRLVSGDITDADRVAAVAAGHDAAISAAADLAADPHDFFTTSARALVDGLRKAAVQRLVMVGLASVLPGKTGGPLMDEPGYPNEYRSFMLGHAAGLDVLRAADLDWLYVAPAGDFDHEGGRLGHYEIPEWADASARISYADFAIALLDEIDTPRHHRRTLAVTG